MRTYYFDQESIGGAASEAWAIGGWAGLRSPWWWDVLQVGVVGYTSQKLYGPRWFLRKLPTGESLDLPMSPQLEETIKSMAAGTE